MQTLAFKVSDVLSAGWKGFTKNFLLLIALVLISFAVNFTSSLFFRGLPFVLFYLINLALSSYIMLSTIKACLMITKGETPGWDVLKNDKNVYLVFFAMNLIFSFILFASALFLILPAILAFAAIFPVQFLIVDKNIAIVDAYKKTWELTTKNYFPCLIFVLATFAIVLAGTLLLGVGLLVALPVVYLSAAEVYRKLDMAEPFETTAAPQTETKDTSAAITEDIIKK